MRLKNAIGSGITKSSFSRDQEKEGLFEAGKVDNRDFRLLAYYLGSEEYSIKLYRLENFFSGARCSQATPG